MNNRKRARIKALKKECRAEMRKCSGHSAKFFVSLRYDEMIGRVAWGDDMADKMFKEFINLTRGVPCKRNPIWKKAVRTVKFAPMPRRAITVFKPVSVGPTWDMEEGE